MTKNSLIILTAIFAASLVASSILASKIISVMGIFVPAGVLAYSITFIVTDSIGEIYGKKTADTVVLSGFAALAITFIMMQLSIILPSAPFWTNQEAYASVIGSTTRIIVASLVAYLISQYHDVWLFHLIKDKTNGKHLWLRNNMSTAVSQFLDSLIFITIAFYGIMPIWPLILGQWTVKIMIAIIDTPIVYAIVGMHNKKVDKSLNTI